MTRSRRATHGQALVALALLLAPLSVAVLAVAGVGRLVADQTRLQAAVDAAAYSAAALQAKTLNEAAVANRVHAAHLVTMGQTAALVSHFRVLDRAARAASGLGLALPALAPATIVIGRATAFGMTASTALARAAAAAATMQDRLLTARVRVSLLATDATIARRVGEVLAAGAPAARLAPATQARLRTAALARAVTRGRPGDVESVAESSADRFTAGRSGPPPIGRTWRLAGVGKAGDTRFARGVGVEAVDRLGVDLGPGRRLSLQARARPGEFGYGRVPAGWALRSTGGPGPVRVEAILKSWGGHDLRARAAAGAVYRRAGHPGEPAHLFGPFWRPRLLPWGTGVAPTTTRRQR